MVTNWTPIGHFLAWTAHSRSILRLCIVNCLHPKKKGTKQQATRILQCSYKLPAAFINHKSFSGGCGQFKCTLDNWIKALRRKKVKRKRQQKSLAAQITIACEHMFSALFSSSDWLSTAIVNLFMAKKGDWLKMKSCKMYKPSTGKIGLELNLKDKQRHRIHSGSFKHQAERISLPAKWAIRKDVNICASY